MNSQHRALITGASGGIGMALARIHAAQGGDLVLVARSEDKLNQLKAELTTQYAVDVVVIVADLSQPGAAAAIYSQTQAADLQIDILINNAGFGGHGYFHQRDAATEMAMIQVNIASLTQLTHCYLPDMVARGQGRVLNVSSVASFFPGPLMAVYYATKAYVTSFSLALAEELTGKGVTVTALCPGPVDTGFIRTGQLENVAVFQQARSAESVARTGYRAMIRGQLIAFDHIKYKCLVNWIAPLLPRRLTLKLSRLVMARSKHQ
ncbi:Serine 3-dehydrogenase [Vibrio aerogenes CECT 7868]|uniref:Serine 3-dehydrogenase n=1 Tax=Vibrio aerogenes CECT 7868 TaxID=1216006 RepID=A0A1M6DCV3_9VIBR|nr:SDR family oxidoreductase [Vibrio aerogenes]SHI71000.1 Serine 3-dehydrogenase [Vibrio aerogenes CECT 7868]